MTTPIPSAAQIVKLRRMIAETASTTYTANELSGYIALYPLPYKDANGLWLDSDDTGWVATWDLAAAAADIWSEKAGAIADRFDFSGDGASHSVSQQVEHYQKMARYWNARRAMRKVATRPEPHAADDVLWLGNMAESRD